MAKKEEKTVTVYSGGNKTVVKKSDLVNKPKKVKDGNKSETKS